MCGIGGLIKSHEVNNELTYKVMSTMTLLLAERGKQATGVYSSEGLGTIRKAPVEPKDFKLWPQRYGQVTFVHTRQATIGDPSDNHNNHPIYGPKYVMVHNGCCSMIPEIKEYKYMGKVDSERLLALVETKGLDGLKDFQGSAAIAFCKKTQPDKVWFWKWGNPLVLGWVDGYGLFFASTDAILRRTIRKNFEHVHSIFTDVKTFGATDGDLIEVNLEDMKITKSRLEPTKKAEAIRWGGDGYDFVSGGKVYDLRGAGNVSRPKVIDRSQSSFWDRENYLTGNDQDFYDAMADAFVQEAVARDDEKDEGLATAVPKVEATAEALVKIETSPSTSMLTEAMKVPLESNPVLAAIPVKMSHWVKDKLLGRMRKARKRGRRVTFAYGTYEGKELHCLGLDSMIRLKVGAINATCPRCGRMYTRTDVIVHSTSEVVEIWWCTGEKKGATVSH
jgi:hypothetical protein